MNRSMNKSRDRRTSNLRKSKSPAPKGDSFLGKKDDSYIRKKGNDDSYYDRDKDVKKMDDSYYDKDKNRDQKDKSYFDKGKKDDSYYSKDRRDDSYYDKNKDNNYSYLDKRKDDSYIGKGKDDSYIGKGKDDSYIGKGKDDSYIGKGKDDSYLGKGKDDSYYDKDRSYYDDKKKNEPYKPERVDKSYNDGNKDYDKKQDSRDRGYDDDKYDKPKDSPNAVDREKFKSYDKPDLDQFKAAEKSNVQPEESVNRGRDSRKERSRERERKDRSRDEPPKYGSNNRRKKSGNVSSSKIRDSHIRDSRMHRSRRRQEWEDSRISSSSRHKLPALSSKNAMSIPATRPKLVLQQKEVETQLMMVTLKKIISGLKKRNDELETDKESLAEQARLKDLKITELSNKLEDYEMMERLDKDRPSKQVKIDIDHLESKLKNVNDFLHNLKYEPEPENLIKEIVNKNKQYTTLAQSNNSELVDMKKKIREIKKSLNEIGN